MASARDALINLHIIAGQVYVWHPKEVDILRKEHHIIGSLIGSLPGAPRQNAQLSLPLQLMPEEATLLLHHGVARLVTMSVARPRKRQVQEFNRRRAESIKEQKMLWQQQQAQRREELRDVIEEGRKRKRERMIKKSAESPSMQPAEKQATEERLKRDCEQGDSSAGRTRAAELEENALRTEVYSVGIGCSKEQYQEDDMKAIDKENEMKMECGIIGTDKSMTRKLGSNEETMQGLEEQEENLPEGDRLEYEEVVSRLPEDSTAENQSEHVGSNTGNLQGDYYDCMIVENPAMTGPNRMKDVGHMDGEIGKDLCVPVERQDERNKRDEGGCVEVVETKDGNGKGCPLACDDQPRSVKEDAVLPIKLSNESLLRTSHSLVGAEEKEDQQHKSIEAHDGNVKEGGCSVQLFTAEPLDSEVILEAPPRMWHYPSNEREKLRYRVFSHFWQMGYFLTSGTKFGGDFLIYPGDPLLFHSYFIVVCVPYDKQLSPLELISHGRLGTFVKKTVVLCSLTRAGRVICTSLQWAGMG